QKPSAHSAADRPHDASSQSSGPSASESSFLILSVMVIRPARGRSLLACDCADNAAGHALVLALLRPAAVAELVRLALVRAGFLRVALLAHAVFHRVRLR